MIKKPNCLKRWEYPDPICLFYESKENEIINSKVFTTAENRHLFIK